MPPRLPVEKFSISPGSVNYAKAKAKYDQQIAAGENWEVQRQLYWQRWTLTRRCITLYARTPYDEYELLNLGRTILDKHKDALEDLVAQVQERMATGEKQSDVQSPSPK